MECLKRIDGPYTKCIKDADFIVNPQIMIEQHTRPMKKGHLNEKETFNKAKDQFIDELVMRL